MLEANYDGTSYLIGAEGLPGAPKLPFSKAFDPLKAEAHIAGLLKRIRAAHIAGERKKIAYLSHQYLTSFDARRLAVQEAYKALSVDRRPPKKTLDSLAGGLDAWVGTSEKVRIWPKEKSPGEFRTIVDFGIEHRARQYLVRRLLQSVADLHPNQFCTVGTHAAVQRVAKLVADGYAWAIETDIKNCYPSFDGKKLAVLLPLPKKVTENVLLSAHLNLAIPDNSTIGPGETEEEEQILISYFFPDARRGIPQGSAASALVAEMLLAPVFFQLLGAGEAIGYTDNTLVMGKEEADAVSMNKALWSALKAHPAGHFRPKKPRIFKPGDPIDFLGHRLTLDGGVVHIEPDPDNRIRFEAKLGKGLACIAGQKDPKAQASEARKLRQYVRSWTAAFKLCPGIGSVRKKALAKVDAAGKGQ